MTHISTLEKPSSLKKDTIERLNTLTYHVFQEKHIAHKIAQSVVKGLSYCYNLMLDKQFGADASLFLQNYHDAVKTLHSITDEEHLQRIRKTLENRVTNIEKIYEENKDINLYLDGLHKMFNVMFAYFNRSYTKELVVMNQKAQLINTFKKDYDQHTN